MTDPRAMAQGIVGKVEWETEVSGFCRCPGEGLHTSSTGKRDCRVSIDGVPTIHCFHAHCVPVVAEANRRLRRELGASPWVLVLPTGAVLRSGDVMKRELVDGEFKTEIVRREMVGATREQMDGERMILESLKAHADRFKPELFEFFHWPMAQILEDSPLLVAERDAEDQFRIWLRIWPACSTVWIGDVFDSGRPEHRTHFRPVSEWYQIGPVMGNYTCGSSFKPGSFRRSNESLEGHRFMVIESDSLGHDEVGAVFAFLNRRLRFSLHAIIDTGGKSLHGWFDAPRSKLLENRLKATLVAFGCDPKVFTYSQPVRVPGVLRDSRLQRLIWLRQ